MFKEQPSSEYIKQSNPTPELLDHSKSFSSGACNYKIIWIIWNRKCFMVFRTSLLSISSSQKSTTYRRMKADILIHLNS